MVYEMRKQVMAWWNTEYKHHSKDMHFRWKIKFWLELLGGLQITGETALPLLIASCFFTDSSCRAKFSSFIRRFGNRESKLVHLNCCLIMLIMLTRVHYKVFLEIYKNGCWPGMFVEKWFWEISKKMSKSGFL